MVQFTERWFVVRRTANMERGTSVFKVFTGRWTTSNTTRMSGMRQDTTAACDSSLGSVAKADPYALPHLLHDSSEHRYVHNTKC